MNIPIKKMIMKKIELKGCSCKNYHELDSARRRREKEKKGWLKKFKKRGRYLKSLEVEPTFLK
ncbi:putative extracellular sulfatase Sulf-1-like protein [Sesbania bispinosa]|nr:putative extracellular sulfatase Sulf-1-like protein [Sesbania bispinosa]